MVKINLKFEKYTYFFNKLVLMFNGPPSEVDLSVLKTILLYW